MTTINFIRPLREPKDVGVDWGYIGELAEEEGYVGSYVNFIELGLSWSLGDFEFLIWDFGW